MGIHELMRDSRRSSTFFVGFVLAVAGSACATARIAPVADPQRFAFIDAPSPAVRESVRDYEGRKLLPNGLGYGDSVRRLSLAGESAASLDQKLTALACPKTVDVLRGPKGDAPLRDAAGKTSPIWIWLCPDGGLVRAKPRGDPTSKFRPQPHASKALRYPFDGVYRGFESETAKVDNSGVVMPKWPADLRSKDPAVIQEWADRTHTDLAPSVFVSDSRIDELRRRVREKIEPQFTAWKEVRQHCEAGLAHTSRVPSHWSVPGYYVDQVAHDAAVLPVETDASFAYAEALCYRITGEKKYAVRAVEIFNAWATTLRTADITAKDSRLAAGEFFPSMIAGADLLQHEGVWASAEIDRFKAFLREVILPLNTMDTKGNNHANWGALLVLSSAAFLDDAALFDRAEARFKVLVDLQIQPDGVLPLEIERGETKGERGIWYTNYALMPMTLGAEILSLHGRSLYDYQSPTGGSLRTAYRKAAEWSYRPKTFPFYELNRGKLRGMKYVSYFEILNRFWPDPAAAALIRRLRPLSVDGSFPYLTFTHGELGSDRG